MRKFLVQLGILFCLAMSDCSAVPAGVTPDRIATGVAEGRAIAATLTALAGTPEPVLATVDPIPMIIEASASASTLVATGESPITATSTPATSRPIQVKPTSGSNLEGAGLGKLVRYDGWLIKVVSARFENLAEKLNFPDKAYPPRSMGFLLVEISLSKDPASETMRFGSADFVIRGGDMNAYTPIGVYLDPSLFPNPLIFPTWIQEQKSYFQAYYLLECGQGCVEYYGYFGKEPQESKTTSEKPLSAGPLIYEHQKGDLWKVLVEGDNWRRVYIFLIPLEATSLQFSFKGSPGIRIGD